MTRIFAPRPLTLLLCAAAALTSFSALAFQQSGKITAGSDMTFFPYEYMENNKPAGFDIELLDGLAKTMGREAVNIDTRFPNLIPGLQGGRFDITNSSMYITAERLKVIDMVPYLKSGEAILARKGGDYQPKTPEDFCGHKIGSMGATSWLAQLQKLSADYCVKKGLKPIALSVYTTDPQTTQALLSRAVDAQITDAAVARGVVEKLGDRVVISSDTLIYPVLNGFGVKKGNTEVKTALEEALKKKQRDAGICRPAEEISLPGADGGRSADPDAESGVMPMRDSDEEQIRIDLAATFRIIAHLGMHEAVANHFSAALSADGKTFLLNPKWKHFSRIRASDLLVLNADDERCAARPDVDATAWAIHGQIHQRLPDVRVVLHLHPVYTTSLACLATPQILPIDQNTARYFNRVAVDTLYGGMADTAAEGARLAGLLADKRRLLMGNHGVLVTAPTIGEAFDDIWTLERACQILITAWSTGQPLKVLSDAVAEKTAQDWEKIADFSRQHFAEMKQLMIDLDPSLVD